MASTPAVPPLPTTSGPSWGPGHVAGVVLGSLIALIALAFAAGGLAMVAMHAFVRDDDGYLNSATRHYATQGHALTVEHVQLGDMHGGMGDWAVEELGGTVRVRADLRGNAPVFVGIAHARDLDRYLSGVAHSEIRDFGHHFSNLADTAGRRNPAAPATQKFWVASASGPGTRTAQWDVTSGDWAAVVMRAAGAAGVDADVRAGARIGWMLWVGVVLLAIGAAGLAGGVGLIVLSGRRADGRGAPPPAAGASTSPALVSAPAVTSAGPTPDGYPVQIRADLVEPLSRWYWLVKWALVIPHLLVLVFLWAALVVSAIAGIATVVVTGRYPRPLFDFNVGVLRWSWRVEMYANGAFATDRYPPFSLDPDPAYPADLEIQYPDRPLPRLKTAFQWLLATPHLLVLGALLGGGWWAQDVRIPGLLPILVVIAVIALLFTGRYPRDIFRLIVGIHRWVIRTVTYVVGMRPEYPPFRL